MAIGIYGTKKLADVNVDDVDILYSYAPSRESIGDLDMKPLFPNLTNIDFKKFIGTDGLYKLRLPSSIFKDLGFYTVQIKPKAFETTILDCSYVITSDNNAIQISKRGIVIPTLQFLKTSSLVGYQIEYFDTNNVKIKNLSRIITSSDLVSISPNNNSITQGSVTYVLDPSGNNLFLTLTPDENSLISKNQNVNIGIKGQKIILSNTYFDPTTIEIEMVEHTVDTLAIALYGNSTRDLETGILTYFDSNNRIYKQYNLYTQKKQFTNGNIDVREIRTIINTNQTLSDTLNEINPQNI